MENGMLWSETGRRTLPRIPKSTPLWEFLDRHLVNFSYVFSALFLAVPTASSESESTGPLLWFILAVVLGVLLIVAIAVLLICYKRRKTRLNEGLLSTPFISSCEA